MQQLPEDEASINQRQQLHWKPTAADKTSKLTTGAKHKRNVEINIDKLINNMYIGIQTSIDKNINKRLEQVARKTIRVATKLKDPKTLQKKVNCSL